MTPSRRRARVTQAEVRRWALALPEVAESSHMGRPDFRVRNKIFATLPQGTMTVNLKCSPPSLDVLVRTHPETFKDVWGGRWVGVTLSRVDPGELRALLTDAWRSAAPIAVAKAFDRDREKHTV